MAKRKSRTKSMFVENPIFEDDQDDEQQIEENSNNRDDANNLSPRGFRHSVRTKKTKTIFDPSEFYGPVHKRKKESIDIKPPIILPIAPPVLCVVCKQSSEKLKLFTCSACKKCYHPLCHVPKLLFPKPLNSWKCKSCSDQVSKVEDVKVNRRKSMATDRRKSIASRPRPSSKKVVPKEVPVEPTVSFSIPETKSPAQERKKLAERNDIEVVTSRIKVEQSITINGAESDTENIASETIQNETIPLDVAGWSSAEVTQYFSNRFGPAAATVFQEEEIDGTALMMMKRADMTSLKLKLGPALKIWTVISTFQTSSSDPTQTWK